jgi:hypothetical protein
VNGNKISENQFNQCHQCSHFRTNEHEEVGVAVSSQEEMKLIETGN